MSAAAPTSNPHGDPRVADVRARLAAAHTASASAPEKAQAKLDAQGKIYVRDRIALLFDEGSLRRGRPLRQRPAARAAGRRRGHRPRHRRRPAGDRHRQRPDGQGRLVGRAHRREDRPRHRDGAARGAAGLLVRRLGRRPHHRPGRDVPRPPRRRPHLPQPGGALGQGAADLLPVRPERRGRRLHPQLLRPHHHGRGQRLDVPRQPAHGRDGRRREGHPRGDGRRPDALHRLRVSATCSPHDDAEAIEQAKLYFSYLPGSWRDHPPTYAAEAAARRR